MIPKKKTNLFRHACKRMQERYGMPYSKKTRDFIINKIRNHEAEFIKRSSRSRTVWKVKMGDVEIRAVYSTKSKEIVTILPDSLFLQAEESEANK